MLKEILRYYLLIVHLLHNLYVLLSQKDQNRKISKSNFLKLRFYGTMVELNQCFQRAGQTAKTLTMQVAV